MADFTMTLAEVLEITDDIGLSKYPIFKDTYRETLNSRIIRSFITREIGLETIELFRMKMELKMELIMPKYNAIYLAQAEKINPFVTSRYKSLSKNQSDMTGGNKESGSAKNDSGQDSTARAQNMEFPQQALAAQGNYGTGATDTFSKTTADSVSTSEGESESVAHSSGTVDNTSEGFSGAMGDLLANFAETFILTDQLIIDELDALFMQLWGAGDSFTTRNNAYGLPIGIGGWTV